MFTDNIRKPDNRRYCCYKGCSSDQKLTRNGAISFFSFPVKDTERCSKWITHCGREEFRYLTPRELQLKRICELHFHRKMFSNDFRTNLTKHAVPVDCKVISQEPIQIDDEGSDEGESGIVSETSSNNVGYEHDQENGDIIVIESNGSDINSYVNGLDDLFNSVLNKTRSKTSKEESELALTPNLELTDPLDNLDSKQCNKENSSQMEKENLETPKCSSSPVHIQEIIVERSPITGAKNKSNSNKGNSNSTEKVSERRSVNTKFHNLPPQTTQSDFYFQQCPTAEETNSFSEPPDGELPLFVQQDSLASLPEERANSAISEPPSKKRKRDKDNDDLADQMRDTMKQMLNISAILNNNENEFELFGKSVALQLKKMSICTALTVQAKIQHLLSQFRINEIQKKAKENVIENGGIEEIRTVQRPMSEEDKLESPQLSLNCTSDTSENHETEIS